MTEREKMLTKENKILIDLVKVCAQLMHAQEDIQAERKRLADLALKQFRTDVHLEPCTLNLVPQPWRYNDFCLCNGKSYTTSVFCMKCGKPVAPC